MCHRLRKNCVSIQWILVLWSRRFAVAASELLRVTIVGLTPERNDGLVRIVTMRHESIFGLPCEQKEVKLWKLGLIDDTWNRDATNYIRIFTNN
jgi:hypothetical protein